VYSPRFSKTGRGFAMRSNGVFRTLVRSIVALILAAAPWFAHAAADPTKTLRITFQVAETGFDPVKIHDYYSGTVIEALYDTLLTYDYLARPSKLAIGVKLAIPRANRPRYSA